MRILCLATLTVLALSVTRAEDPPPPRLTVRALDLPGDVQRHLVTAAGVDATDFRWIVVGNGTAAPKYYTLGEGKGSFVIVETPRDGSTEAVVYVVALVKGVMSEPAVVRIPAAGGDPPTGPPTVPVDPPSNPIEPPEPNVDAALAKAKGLHAFLIFDLNAGDRAMAQLTQSGNVAAKLAKSGGAWHEFDYRAKEIKAANLAGKFQAGQLPVLIVLDGNKKPAPVLAVTPLKLTGSLAKDEALVLSAFAKAVK